jgi:hypothetical protein
MKRALKAVVCAVSILAGAGSAQAAQLVNGGFEQLIAAEQNIVGWTKTNQVFAVGCAGSSVGCAPNGGAVYANLAPLSGGSASLTQTVTVTNAGPFSFGAWVSLGTDDPVGNFDQAQINLSLQGNSVNQTIGLDPNLVKGQFTVPGGGTTKFTQWFQLSGLLNFVGSGDLLININAQNAANGKSIFMNVDNVYISAVPVPAGILLMGTAIAGLGALRRRAKAA